MQKIVVDLSDLIVWYKHHLNVTGIQRVVEQIFSQREYFDLDNVEFIFRHVTGGDFYTLDKNIIFMLANSQKKTEAILQIRNLRNTRFTINYIKCLYDLFFSHSTGTKNNYKKSRIFEFKGNEVCIISGAFWQFNDSAAVYNNLKEEKNVRIILFIYDLIPITHHYFCDDSLVNVFKRQLDEIISNSDTIISISQYTKMEIEKYTKAQDVQTPPIEVLNFGFGSKILRNDPNLETQNLKALNLLDVDYALCVGTIEPRKNPGLLLDVWRDLFQIYGDKTPTLVFAGRHGWKVDWFFSDLLKCNYLDGKIKVIQGLDDQNLALLYSKAKVVLFPSYIEGWGLPVEEAIAFGKYTLASNQSSIPEAGRDCAFYFDPFDHACLQEELIKCFNNKDYISKKEIFISKKREEYARNYTWPKTAEQLLDIISDNKKSFS